MAKAFDLVSVDFKIVGEAFYHEMFREEAQLLYGELTHTTKLV